MAIITDDEMVPLRRGCAAETESGGLPIHWTKAEFKAAVQAVEDEYQATCRAAFGTAIETAVPGKFSNPEKKCIGRWWFTHRFKADAS